MRQQGSKGQQVLPFGEAEGSFAERKELLGLAMQKENVSLYEAQFMLWLFNTTDGGVRGWLEKSYAELAARPWGLCCHPNQAAATVRRCAARGWVAVESTLIRTGIQGPNRYVLQWSGIKSTLLVALRPQSEVGGRRSMVDGQGTGVARGADASLPRSAVHTTCDPPHTTCDPPHTTCDPPHTTCEGIGITPSGSESDIRTEPEGRVVPMRGQPAGLSSWLREVPELSDAVGRKVLPLPPAETVYGAFQRLTESQLTGARQVLWFRQQLSSPRPVTGNSEAELLLCIAAARAAAMMPREEVTKSRVAVFVGTVSHGKWGKVLGHVPEARKTLDALLEIWPECLTHPEGAGPKREQVTA